MSQEYVSALSNLLPSGQAELGQAAKDKVQQLINEAVRALPSQAHSLYLLTTYPRTGSPFMDTQTHHPCKDNNGGLQVPGRQQYLFTAPSSDIAD